MAWYAGAIDVREPVLEGAIAAMAGYFAAQAWRPPIPGLPRVRSIQRRQLKTCLPWIARRVEIEPPGWVTSIPD
jgi:hypothetical protein